MRHKAVAVWLALLVVCGVIVARTNYRTDMGDFLPHSASLAQQVLAGQVNGGAASHIILLGLTAAPAPVLAALSQSLAAQLRQQPAFLDILNGSPDSFAGVQDYMWQNRYLLSPQVTAAEFSAAGLHAALQKDLSLLGSALGMALGASLPSDPTGEMLVLLNRLGSGKAPAMADGVWLGPDGTALLLVHTAAPGFDLDAQQQAQAIIRAQFAIACAATSGAGSAKLQMSGPGVFAVATRDVTKSDVQRLSILAMLGAAALLAFAYRSPRVLLLGLLPIVSGALAAIAAVSLSFGFVHGITLGFGVTLIGESLDYAIYLFTQTGRGEQGGDTLARIWPTLRLGALTSIAGFCAMLASSFTGFAQLGLFSIAGLIAAALTTRFVLPQLMPRGFFAPGAAVLSRPAAALIRHRPAASAAVATALAAAVIALLLHRGGMWDGNLLNLSPIPAAQQQLDDRLRQDLGLTGQRYFAVFTAATPQLALQQSEALTPALDALVAAKKLSGFSLPSGILPSAQTQRQRQAALPGTAALTRNFTQAAAGLPFNTQAFAPFLRDAAAARTAALLTPATLPPALALQFGSLLSRNGANWVVMAPLDDVADPAAVANALTAAGPPGLAFVDLNQQSGQLLGTFQSQAVSLAGFGSLAILLILCLGLRSIRRAAAIAIPLAIAVTVTAAILTLGGAKLSIFMVAGFLLIVAIGSNYCLFFERSIPGSADWPRAAASIVLANFCTVAAYGLLSFSRIPVLHDIGLTVAIGTFSALICGAVLSTPRPHPAA
jgi:predicted exporter